MPDPAQPEFALWRRLRIQLAAWPVSRHLFGSSRRPSVLMLLSIVAGAVAGLLAASLQLGSAHLSTWLTAVPESTFWLPAWLFLPLACAVLTALACAFTHFVSPESAGSGIPEIEGAMQGVRVVRWVRVLPVKLLGGIAVLGAFLPLGREGPSVHIGGAVGAMFGSVAKLSRDGRHALLAAGAAGGLAAAFNAPLAGVMFILEEMRPQFRYSLIGMKCVFFGAIAGTIVCRGLVGQKAALALPQFPVPELSELWIYMLLGLLFGCLGILFNALLPRFLDGVTRIHQHQPRRKIGLAAMAGALIGVLAVVSPDFVGSGMHGIPEWATHPPALIAIAALFIGKLLLVLACFSLGIPGGIFAPILTLGTLFGVAYGGLLLHFAPHLSSTPGAFAVAGMGALFAATVRAPVTGILLVIEMTDNYQLILPMLITCVGATITAQAFGGKPVYGLLLARTLRLEQKTLSQPEWGESPLDRGGKDLLIVGALAVATMALLSALVNWLG